MSLINKILGAFFGGSKSDKDIKSIAPVIELIRQFEAKCGKLSNDELRAYTTELRKRIAEASKEKQAEIDGLRASLDSGDEQTFEQREKMYLQIDTLEKEIDGVISNTLDSILPEAFAIMKDTARRFTENKHITVTANDSDRELALRKQFVKIEGDKAIYSNEWIAGGNTVVWDMIHYDVQLIGGTILHQGKIAEMTTGEGKTLVSTLPVFLNALPGRGVHVVTVNDYLAKRDSEWMGTMYEFHGLMVDCIDRYQPNSPDRRKAYRADITYGTNNEFGFDYLRDNMATSPEDLVQRTHNFAIVDEVDSVLIDDARTPLIISGPVPKGNDQLYNEYRPKVEKIYEAQRTYITKILAEAKKLIGSADKKQAEEGAKLLLRCHKGLPKNRPIIKYLSEPGMKALLQKTENFYMQDNNKQMHIVTDELFFVINEQHNSIELTDKGHEFISGDTGDKDFFIMTDIGSLLAEIENLNCSAEEKLERKDLAMQEYVIKSERVHTVNQLLKAYALFDKDVEYVLMDNKVKIVDEQTGRIMEGRRYSDGLHQAIEAKERVKVEAATQTFASVTLQNYFRMYKKLAGMTGTAETEAKELWDIYKLDVVVAPTNRPIQRKDMEDLVYRTKREKYNAVIDHVEELTKANRPVLVGTTSVEISELLARMLSRRNIKHNVLNAKLHQREADIVAEAGMAQNVTIATNMAGRGTDIKLSQAVKDAGGLAIVGTERHESRRVDRQLRGRAGRQGDPGSSQFFVSLEDDLMRMFGSDRIAKIMDRIGIEEGEVIQHSMISRSIERAQKKVEENNFGVRKRLLEYDDVMNSQREVVYTKRRNALLGERIGIDFANMIYDLSEALAADFEGSSDYTSFSLEILRTFGIQPPVQEAEFMKLDKEDLAAALAKAAQETYKRKMDGLCEKALPAFKKVLAEQGDRYKNIVVPIGDGNRIFHIVSDLQKGVDTNGKELVKTLLKTIMLITIDEAWKEHLRELDDLKQSVQNASYEQKDPLLIYKFESFKLFSSMLDKINREVVSTMVRSHIPMQAEAPAPAASEPKRVQEKYVTNKQEPQPALQQNNREAEPQQAPKAQPVRVEKVVGRNEPCPCGSGKKYKNCHGN
jgi:preprotein translocase subunit SecA